MRLVYPPAEDGAEPMSTMEPAAISLLIHDDTSGRVLLKIALSLPAIHAPLCGMTLSAANPGGVEPTRPHVDVAGRIQSGASELEDAVTHWLDHLNARSKKAASIRAMRQVVRCAMRERGWRTCAELTYDALVGWLDEKRAGWKGSTYNRNLSVFRSLTKELTRRGKLQADPLLLVDRADNDGGEGARAATLDEARAMIRQAWSRGECDGRSSGARALYTLCLFAHGCRHSEPGRWRRRHLVLEHEHPHLAWTAEIQKTPHTVDIPLTHELAVLLRRHLEAADAERSRSGLPPAEPDDPVFPIVPTRVTWRQDRQRANLLSVDNRGRGLTPHSARKFFSTHLTAVGVPEKIVDKLMRHSGRVEHRYYDPTLAEMAAEVAKLPRLWPAPSDVDNWNPRGVCLTEGRDRADDDPANPVRSSNEPQSSVPRPGKADRIGIQSGPLPGDASVGHTRAVPAVTGGRSKPPKLISPEMPISELINAVDRNDLADLLTVLARLLRGAGHGNEDSRAS